MKQTKKFKKRVLIKLLSAEQAESRWSGQARPRPVNMTGNHRSDQARNCAREAAEGGSRHAARIGLSRGPDIGRCHFGETNSAQKIALNQWSVLKAPLIGRQTRPRC